MPPLDDKMIEKFGAMKPREQSTLFDSIAWPSHGKGHTFSLRTPMSKVTARKCAECDCDIYEHARREVPRNTLLTVFDFTAEERASVIVPGELLVGAFKAVVTELGREPQMACVNCAGPALHAFLPKALQPAFEVLRAEERHRDLEWEDTENFQLSEDEVLDVLRWARLHTHEGRPLLLTCVQGKSRSGALAVAYLMAMRDMPLDAALALVKSKRPLVEPNPSFMRQLKALEGPLRAEGRKWSMLPSLLAPRAARPDAAPPSEPPARPVAAAAPIPVVPASASPGKAEPRPVASLATTKAATVPVPPNFSSPQLRPAPPPAVSAQTSSEQSPAGPRALSVEMAERAKAFGYAESPGARASR